MDKSPDAFRTISEVAEILETPAHVLRFWETRFPQIKPVKRAGGRRYYRPADVALLTGIRRLLHEDGLTIRDVQKMLRDQGVKFVSAAPGATPEPPEEADVIVETRSPDNVVAFGERSAPVEVVQVPPSPAVEPPAEVAVDVIHVPAEPAPEEAELPTMPAAPRHTGGSLPGQTSFDFGFPATTPLETVPAPPPVESPLFPEGASESWDHVPITHVEAAPDDGLYPSVYAPETLDDRPWLPARLRALSPEDRHRHAAALQALLPRLSALHARLIDKRAGARG